MAMDFLIDPLFVAWHGPLQALPARNYKAYVSVAQTSSPTEMVFLACFSYFGKNKYKQADLRGHLAGCVCVCACLYGYPL
jgi:hypothetical protein